jgi:uncharacterized protein YgbK (DUF1537 family)
MPRMLIVADDLTGAVDVAAAFKNAKPNSLCVVSAWTNDCETNWSSINDGLMPDLICINTDSRNISEHEARMRVNRAIKWSEKKDFRLMKKVDSLLRGNVRAEVDEFLNNDYLGARPALFAPALPSHQRTTMHGIQRVNGVPVSKSEAASDPLAPSLESDLRNLIPSNRLAVLIPLDQVRGDGFSATLRSFSNMNAVFIPDVENDTDLEKIFNSATELEDLIFIGSAGLLASSVTLNGNNHFEEEANLLIVSLSLRSETSSQFKTFIESNPGTQIIEIKSNLKEGSLEIGAQVLNSFTTHRNVILKLSGDNLIASDARKREQVAHSLVQHTVSAIYDVIGKRTKPLILVLLGGDISQQFCKLASIRALTVVGTICQGGAICKLPEDSELRDLTLVIRSGGFGDKNSLLELRQNIPITKVQEVGGR